MDKERDDRLAPVQPGHLSRHQRGLVEFGLALSRKDIKKSEGLEEFKEKILEALELLKNDRMQDAAFKIDDAMMFLPPEKRIDRGGVAEWAREWWNGHLVPIRLNGGKIPGEPPAVVSGTHGGSDLYLTLFNLFPDTSIKLIADILDGKFLRPHLPNRDNPESTGFGLSGFGDESQPLLFNIMALLQVSEYANHPKGASYSPWLNTVLGLMHASFAHEPSCHKGIRSLVEEYAPDSVVLANTDRDVGKILNLHGSVPEELVDLLSKPRERSEWARLNDEMAVRYLRKAIRYTPYESTFHLHASLATCLYRLGETEEASRHLKFADPLPTVFGDKPPIPVHSCILGIQVFDPDQNVGDWRNENDSDVLAIWDPYGTNINEENKGRVNQDRTFPILGEKAVKIGRSDDNDIVLKGDRRISAHHAELSLDDGVIWIKDLGSKNGTVLNDPYPIPELGGSSSPKTECPEDANLPVPLHAPQWTRIHRVSEIILGRTYLIIGPVNSGMSYGVGYAGETEFPRAWNRPWRHRLPHLWGFPSGKIDLKLENLDKAIEASAADDQSVPFELYHLRSELHEALGNQELSERDRQSAEESLAAEFARV
jgi:hypothetical protein